MRREIMPMTRFQSGDPANKGYNFIESSQFIEFCVDLDSQDDRLTEPNNPKFIPQIDKSLWNPKPIYDSRTAVATDVIEYRNHATHSHWEKLYQDILARARHTPPSSWTVEAVAADPRYNGFGRYQTAWSLYEGGNENRGSYAIAIRGTVFAATPSVVEDVLFHPVSANQFLSPTVSFASFPGAAVHSGFAHATFSLLLDDRYGVLRALHDLKIPDGARLYIVGHSQGASMATLTHAFFHHGMQNATGDNNPFELYGKNYRLKSYVFAQPKPGNFLFAADFASATQATESAIVINNYIDPVPQVPLTLQDLSDLDGDLPGTSLPGRILHYLGGIGSGFRGAFARISEPFVRQDNAGYGYYFQYDKLGGLGQPWDITESSWNFVPAGQVRLVFGTPGDPSDAFLQHHAWTYRNLVQSQLR